MMPELEDELELELELEEPEVVDEVGVEVADADAVDTVDAVEEAIDDDAVALLSSTVPYMGHTSEIRENVSFVPVTVAFCTDIVIAVTFVYTCPKSVEE